MLVGGGGSVLRHVFVTYHKGRWGLAWKGRRKKGGGERRPRRVELGVRDTESQRKPKKKREKKEREGRERQREVPTVKKAFAHFPT